MYSTLTNLVCKVSDQIGQDDSNSEKKNALK